MESIHHFERLCTDFYSPSSEEARKAAQDILNNMMANPDCVPQLQSVLATSKNQHAVVFSATALTKIITTNWLSITDNQKLEMSKFMVNYLFESCLELQATSPHAIIYLIRFLSRIVKLGWLDSPKHQTIVADLKRFFEATPSHYLLGLDIFAELIADMQPTSGAQVSRFRRTALSFRDTALFQIFETSMTSLRAVQSGALPYDEGLLRRLLKVIVGAMGFDFLGSCPDETADDSQSVMIPHSFNFMRDPALPLLFLEIYDRCCGSGFKQAAILALQSCVLFASFRRSFYVKEAERVSLTSNWLAGTSQLLRGRKGLNDPDCFHEVCRLLGRIRTNESLIEMLENTQFLTWLDLVFSFTIEAFNAKHIPVNSKHYLTGFWAALSPSLSRLSLPPGLADLLRRVALAYVGATLTLSDDNSEALEDDVIRTEQVEVVSLLGASCFEVMAKDLSSRLTTTAHADVASWGVYFAAGLITGQAEPGRRTGEAEIQVAGELAMVVFKVLGQNGGERLELAGLQFIESLRRIYLAEQGRASAETNGMNVSKSRLAASMGLEDDDSIMTLIVSKLMSNLNGTNEEVIKKTLQLFYELCASVTFVEVSDANGSQLIQFGRILLKNATVQDVIRSHSERPFPFLREAKLCKYRTMYYHALGRLVFLDIKDRPDLFSQFMVPLGQRLWAMASAPDRSILVGLCRDLRGLSLAAQGSEAYGLLFKFLVDDPRIQGNSKITLFSAALEAWGGEFEVALPILKFVAEFVHNRQNRITFEQNSPSGLLLFREACKVLVSYGQRLANDPPGHKYVNVYKQKYKGIGLSLQAFFHALTGNYANLGLFELYGDQMLQVSFNVAIRLCLSVPLADLLSYPKAFKVYFAFMDALSRNHATAIMTSEGGRGVCQILRALEEGLSSFDNTIAMQSCSAVDNICSYVFDNPNSMARTQDLEVAFQRLLTILCQLVVSGEFSSTWSLSRPLCVLVLLEPGHFNMVSQQLAASQILEERRVMLSKGFSALLKDVAITSPLSVKARETFTKNLYELCQQVKTTTAGSS